MAEHREPRIAIERESWWQRAIMLFFRPLMLLGTVYVLLFFFLNSHPFERLVEAQLDHAMKGDWTIGDVTVSPSLLELRIDHAALDTPEGEPVVVATDIRAPIPWGALYGLVEDNHLDLADIDVGHATVILDFRDDGPFNLSRAVEPATPSSDDEPSDFSIAFRGIDVRNADVDLLFQGFTIDVNKALVTKFDLTVVGGELTMQSDPNPLSGSRIEVSDGSIELEAGLMAFPLGEYGPVDQGLIEDGGSGAGGAAARIATLTSRALHQTCARSAARSEVEAACRTNPPDARGHLEVHIMDAVVNNFWWRGMTYGLTDLTATLVDRSGDGVRRVGQIALDQPWMNVAPTAEEIAAVVEEHDIPPPETRPEETLLYYAAAALELDGDAHPMRWFFGDLITSKSSIFVGAEVVGDLNHPEGNAQVVADHLAVAGIDVADVRFSGDLDGQRFELLDFVGRTLTGAIELVGHYMILDGDYAVSAELGAIDAESLEAVDGIDLSSLVPAEFVDYVKGELTGGLSLEQTARKLTVTLDEPLRLVLDRPLPYNEASLITLDQAQSGQLDCPSLVKMENRVIRTGDEIRLNVGDDSLRFDPELVVWLDSMTVEHLGVHLDIDDLGAYASAFGVPVRTRQLSIDATVDGSLYAPSAAASLVLRGGEFADLVSVPEATAEVSLSPRGRLTIGRLKAKTSLGNIDANGWVDVFRGDLRAIRDEMALDIGLEATGIELAALPVVGDAGLSGSVDASGLQVTGTTLDPRVRGRIEARDLTGFGDDVPYLEASVDLDMTRARVADVQVAYGTPRSVGGGRLRRAQLRLGEADYDFGNRSFRADRLTVTDLHVQDVPWVREAAPITARVDLLETSMRGDLDVFLGGRIDQDSFLDGAIQIQEIEYDGRPLGAVQVEMSTPSTSEVKLSGIIAPYTRDDSIGGWPLEVRADLDGPSATLGLEFERFRVFDLAPEVDVAINGENPVSGRLVPKLEIGGRIDASWSASQGAEADLALSELTVWAARQEVTNHRDLQIHYSERENEVSIDRMELVHDGRAVMIYGTYGLDGMVDLEVNGEVGAQLARMAGDSIAEARGSLAVGLELGGDIVDAAGNFDLGNLALQGFAAVRNPVNLRVRGLGDPIVVESGVVYVEQDCELSGMDCFRIPIERAFRGEALGGSFELSGEVGRVDAFQPVSAELLAQGSDLSYRLKDTLTVTFDIPELRLFVFDLRDLDLIPPRLYGHVEVTEGRYYRDHLVQSEIFQAQLGALTQSNRRDERFETPIWQRFPALAAVELDVVIDSKSGFRIDNSVAGAAVDIELEFNNVRIGGTLQDIRPNGIVNIRDGLVAFRQTKFEVLPGAQLRFNKSLDAIIDVSAQAEVNTQSGFAASITGGATRDRRRITTSDLASGNQLYIVTLSLTGPLSALKWTLESNPFLTSNNIYTLILTGKTLEDLGQERDDSPAFDIAFDSLLAPFFESQVDEILSADQFKFQFAEGAAQFSYIQQVNRALRIAAGVSIRGAEGNESAIAGEYRFDDRLLLELIAQDTIEEEGKAPVFRVGTRLEWRLPLD